VFINISEYKISIFLRKVFVDNIDIIIHYKVIFTLSNIFGETKARVVGRKADLNVKL